MGDNIGSKMRDSYSGYIVQKAEVITLPQVKRFYRDNGLRAQAAKADDVYVLKRKTELLAALRLCPLDESYLLRSMCVKEGMRREGLGGFFLAELQSVLETKQCYSFPYSRLQSFYENAGFVCKDIESAPDVISILFKRYLDGGKKIILMQYCSHLTK